MIIALPLTAYKRKSETANIRFTFQFTGYLKGIRPTATRLAPYSPSYLAQYHLPV